jgi:hypothetical protein
MKEDACGLYTALLWAPASRLFLNVIMPSTMMVELHGCFKKAGMAYAASAFIASNGPFAATMAVDFTKRCIVRD